MSARLLSEFDTYYQSPQSQQQLFPASSAGEITSSVFDDLACLDNNGAQPSSNSSRKLSNGSLSWSKEKSEDGFLQSSNTGKVKDAVLSAMTAPAQLGSKFVAPSNQTRETNSECHSEVLFDALEELGKVDDADEFGDFETGVDVLALMSSPDNGHETNLTESETALPGVTASQTTLKHGTQSGSLQPTRKTPSDDEWGDFEYAAKTAPMTRNVLKQGTDKISVSPRVYSSTKPSSSSILEAAVLATVKPDSMISAYSPARDLSTRKAGCLSPKPEAVSPLNELRSQIPHTSAAPSNIPPPSVLLPLLTTILQRHYNTISSLQECAISDLAKTNPAYDLLKLASVAAHIIAGRKLRWKRDMLLAQNMRFGPSHSGKAGGMKLTGIDRAEVLREDREVVDLVRIWKDHLGRVRTAVGGVSPSGASMSKSVPGLAETLPVRVEKGALSATKACALCGLKREERIDKVDEVVEDSFGEWWVEHWGHTTCNWFWDRYHDQLRQR